jgi:hypothetical protein
MPDQTLVLVAEDEELVRLVIVQTLLDDRADLWRNHTSTATSFAIFAS